MTIDRVGVGDDKTDRQTHRTIERLQTLVIEGSLLHYNINGIYQTGTCRVLRLFPFIYIDISSLAIVRAFEIFQAQNNTHFALKTFESSKRIPLITSTLRCISNRYARLDHRIVDLDPFLVSLETD